MIVGIHTEWIMQNEITENENIYVDFNAIVGWAQKEGIVDK